MAESESFAAAAKRHRAEILAYLSRLLDDPHEAEDACQDVWVRAQRAWTRLRPGSNVRAWLFRIATNCARTAFQRRRTVALADPDVLPGREASPELREDLRRVARAIAGLPPRQRAALVLRRFHGLDYAGIAASLGGSETTARANVYQAVRKLRAALER